MTEQYFKDDPQFGRIVDFESLRPPLKETYDLLSPEFSMLGCMQNGSRLFDDQPSLMIAAGASMLAWQMLLAADENELAEELKDSIFTLGWTEEHVGSDLLSIQTQATPVSDDPDETEFYLEGGKWLINNSYHADYHMVLAKIDPEQSGPRSLSLFLVPHSSTKNWERLETHVLSNMVLTKYDIDGPGRLVGKRGRGLTIVQRMAMPSKYQCAYVGMAMVQNAIEATIDHLSSKRIFGNAPINFSNVFRQMYNLVLQGAFLSFFYHRAVVFSDSSFLAFHGTMLKSFLLLRANEALSQNLLVAGSKGFLKESIIGRDAIDSFVLPVFDGHYTINTLISVKYLSNYLDAEGAADVDARVEEMRERLYVAEYGDQINKSSREIRRPDFFGYVDHWQALDVPLDLDPQIIVDRMRTLLAELDDTPLPEDPDKALSSGPEYKYKTGTLLHWMEAIMAAGEFWKVTENDNYLNVIVQQYNGFVNEFNRVISEGVLQTPFLTPMKHQPLPEVEDNETFLRELLDVEAQIEAFRQQTQAPVAGD
jgi:alkylation response protein AidB-like acyl-CoA dehydrogenase